MATYSRSNVIANNNSGGGNTNNTSNLPALPSMDISSIIIRSFETVTESLGNLPSQQGLKDVTPKESVSSEIDKSKVLKEIAKNTAKSGTLAKKEDKKKESKEEKDKDNLNEQAKKNLDEQKQKDDELNKKKDEDRKEEKQKEEIEREQRAVYWQNKVDAVFDGLNKFTQNPLRGMAVMFDKGLKKLFGTATIALNKPIGDYVGAVKGKIDDTKNTIKATITTGKDVASKISGAVESVAAGTVAVGNLVSAKLSNSYLGSAKRIAENEMEPLTADEPAVKEAKPASESIPDKDLQNAVEKFSENVDKVMENFPKSEQLLLPQVEAEPLTQQLVPVQQASNVLAPQENEKVEELKFESEPNEFDKQEAEELKKIHSEMKIANEIDKKQAEELEVISDSSAEQKEDLSNLLEVTEEDAENNEKARKAENENNEKQSKMASIMSGSIGNIVAKTAMILIGITALAIAVPIFISNFLGFASRMGILISAKVADIKASLQANFNKALNGIADILVPLFNSIPGVNLGGLTEGELQENKDFIKLENKREKEFRKLDKDMQKELDNKKIDYKAIDDAIFNFKSDDGNSKLSQILSTMGYGGSKEERAKGALDIGERLSSEDEKVRNEAWAEVNKAIDDQTKGLNDDGVTAENMRRDMEDWAKKVKNKELPDPMAEYDKATAEIRQKYADMKTDYDKDIDWESKVARKAELDEKAENAAIAFHKEDDVNVLQREAEVERIKKQLDKGVSRTKYNDLRDNLEHINKDEFDAVVLEWSQENDNKSYITDDSWSDRQRIRGAYVGETLRNEGVTIQNSIHGDKSLRTESKIPS